MTLQYSTNVRNAMLDAFESTTGATAHLKIFTGTAPADCSVADSGTLLVEMTLPSDWMAAAASGAKAKSGTWSGTASATGTAGYFRIYDSTVTTCHQQGTVTATSGGGDIELDNTSINSGQTVTISTFTITEGNP